MPDIDSIGGQMMDVPHSSSQHLLQIFAKHRTLPSFPNSRYDGDEDSIEDGSVPKRRSLNRSRWDRASRTHTALHVLSLLVISVPASWAPRNREKCQKSCITRQSIYCSSSSSATCLRKNGTNCFRPAPILDVLDDEYQTWKLNGTFRDYSPYKGPPNADVDKPWADLFSCMSPSSTEIE